MFYTFFSLRIPLVNESTEIRAATLRTIRHLTTTNEAATAISILNIHYLIRQKKSHFLMLQKSDFVFLFFMSFIVFTFVKYLQFIKARDAMAHI